MTELRVGLGFDLHGWAEDRPLFLGGVRFEGEPGLKGHSDGDVVCHAVADALEFHRPAQIVLDPVMVATSGDRLLEPSAEREILARLVPLATLVTPNLDEAALLTGFPVEEPPDMERAGRVLLVDDDTALTKPFERLLGAGLITM